MTTESAALRQGLDCACPPGRDWDGESEPCVRRATQEDGLCDECRVSTACAYRRVRAAAASERGRPS